MQTLKTDIKQRILQVAHREFINNGVQRTCITPVRNKFIMQIVLTALIFPHIQAVPLAYSHKSNMP